jgi:hypothetical protein
MDQTRIAKLTGRTLDAMSKGKHPKLGALKMSDPDYASKLASDAGYQPETTTIERVAQNIPDSEFTKPDTQLQDYSLIKSIEIIKHLKRECQRRHYKCTINDERQFDPEDPFIALHIDGNNSYKHQPPDNAIDFSVHFGCSGTLEECNDINIDIYDNLMRGVFEPYDYHSINPNLQQPDAFKNVALQILDIVEKAAYFEF